MFLEVRHVAKRLRKLAEKTPAFTEIIRKNRKGGTLSSAIYIAKESEPD